MTRVVPSQVREFIETEFGKAIAPEWNIPRDHSAKLAGLLMICEKLPDELLTPIGPDYAKYIVALGAIRHQLAAWFHKVDPPTLPHIFGKNAVSLIYETLKLCPDEFPSAATTSLAFIADAQLRESIRLDVSAANHDFGNHEYKGATVLAGSATEALLLWAIKNRERRQRGATKEAVAAAVRAKDLHKEPGQAQPEQWNFAELIEVALHLKCIEEQTAQQARLGKDFRNLIHPGRAARLKKKCDRGTAHAALAAVEFVARDIGRKGPTQKRRGG
jgi:hypothetical protein